ncbi:expressed unknown protein [Ectocarpus siliculosus]|uniref:Uncharacterized protein n=1 Tax=Ectocarpus siliculosus TaxID=2880 RepID=D8LSR4_ECTSI|nr:expressed unknown protein [Ectocarpus siliculosus]|eukprot:CBN75264.1 expressed unknown protein [Ectocarpus siliculosus]
MADPRTEEDKAPWDSLANNAPRKFLLGETKQPLTYYNATIKAIPSMSGD